MQGLARRLTEENDLNRKATKRKNSNEKQSRQELKPTISRKRPMQCQRVQFCCFPDSADGFSARGGLVAPPPGRQAAEGVGCLLEGGGSRGAAPLPQTSGTEGGSQAFKDGKASVGRNQLGSFRTGCHILNQSQLPDPLGGHSLFHSCPSRSLQGRSSALTYTHVLCVCVCLTGRSRDQPPPPTCLLQVTDASCCKARAQAASDHFLPFPQLKRQPCLPTGDACWGLR